MIPATALEWLLVGAIFPLWMLAGAADWLCHRASGIERTSGARESRLHLLLYAEIALPVLALTLFQATAPILALMTLGVAAHFVTSWADTRYAQPKRFISPFEQQVHGFLEMLPLFALVLLGLLSLDQWTTPTWRLAPRDLPASIIVPILGALGVGAGLIIEEWWRCRRHASGGTQGGGR
jgi:hypothetical protein